MAARAIAPTSNRLLAALRKEATKAAMLTFLVAVLLVLWVRMAMRNGESSAIARAMTNPNATSLSSESNSARSADATSALRGWLSDAPPPIKRNLFAVNLEQFPVEKGGAGAATNTDGGFWGELAKSVSTKADVTKERQILLENLQQQASQLRLQTTVMGMKPKAVVNGELVGIGDVVASGTGEARTTFRVLKIEPRRITIEREGIKLEVPMR